MSRPSKHATDGSPSSPSGDKSPPATPAERGDSGSPQADVPGVFPCEGVESFSALQLVRRPRAISLFVRFLGVLILVTGVSLAVLPWQQNVPAVGRVTAIDPRDRQLTIPAPVTGRLVETFVIEGSRVEQGQVLARMADQDPQYTLRLEQQLSFAQDKRRAARDTVDFYARQLEHLEDYLELAVSGAQFELNVATQKVEAARRDLEAAEADFDQKKADRDRRYRLFLKQIASELDFQKAEADYLTAAAKVEAAKAKVAQAQNEEKAKLTKVGQVREEMRAKIESTKSLREDARSKVALAEKEVTEALTKLERQKTQTIEAPRDGQIFRVRAANTAELISKGAPLIDLVPDATDLGVELWVRGVDAPLVSPGRKVRLQFEGWPAVQFAGWPSVAVGTFGGVVSVVDALDDGQGRFRVLVRHDPEDEPWPDRKYLRQGVKAKGWLLLDEVSLFYEIWRQLNAFPPSLSAPDETGKASGKGGASKSAGKPNESESG